MLLTFHGLITIICISVFKDMSSRLAESYLLLLYACTTVPNREVCAPRQENISIIKLRMICKVEIRKLYKSLMFGNSVDCVSDIEIDEGCFGKKRKNNKGKYFKKQWIFGIVERGTRKLLLKIVPDRTQATLLPIITAHISTSANVHHDDWPSYRSLHKMGYQDLIVNHTQTFKGLDGACTNTIEGIWGVLKQRIIRMHGIDSSKLEDYVDEYVFRYYHKDDMIQAMVKAISEYKSI